jgi:DNA-binding LacI/PurR family transcriptional regulator/DNA-binding transcriptional regulator YhcF (GntR family)
MRNLLNVAEGDRKPLYDRIAEAVCEAVAQGRFAPGDKLPTETALATELKINRLTVSRAYERLQSRGVVRQRRGSGSYVSPDALHRVRHRGGRAVSTVAFILGETSLARCPREYLFIITDILEGIHDVLGGPQRTLFLDSLLPESTAGLTEHDAIVHMNHKHLDPTLPAALLDRDLRLVSLWEDAPLRGVPNIDYDRDQSASLAVRHLIDGGSRRVGYIGSKSPPNGRLTAKFAAFTSVLNESGIDLHARYIREASVQPGKAYAAARDILQSGDLPEAIFVDTDYKAMEVLCALNDAGVRVPDHVRVAGYDNVPESATLRPSLTTVDVPRREIGRRAARMLLDWPEGGGVPESLLLTSKLIIRDSSGVSGKPSEPM